MPTFDADVRRGVVMLIICITLLAPRSGWPFFLSAAGLTASALVTSRIIGGRTLSRATQAVVGFFVWWFLVGAIARVFVLESASGTSVLIIERVTAAMIVCALGLPLLAVGVRLSEGTVVAIWGRSTAPLRLPDSSDGLVLIALTAVCCQALFSFTNIVMPNAVQEVGFLGGTQTNVWWVGVLAACVRVLSPLSAILALSLWLGRRKQGDSSINLGIAALTLGLLVLLPGVLSGWKAPTVELVGALLLLAMFHRQRIPWIMVGLVVIVYVGVLDPTVRTARDRIIQGRDVSSEAVGLAIRESFVEVVTGKVDPPGIDERGSALLAPFRGLSELGGEIILRASLTDGGGQAATVSAGLMSAVPRVLLPSKPDLDIGASYARDYGVDLDVVSVTDNLTNISPSIPFDVASQFGILAAIGSFFVLGLIWGSLEGVLLGTPLDGLPHPLVGWLAFSAWKLESSVGSWIAEVRDLVVVLFVLVLVRTLFEGKWTRQVARLLDGKT